MAILLASVDDDVKMILWLLATLKEDKIISRALFKYLSEKSPR